MTENKYKVSKYCVAKNLSCILDKNGNGLMMNKEIADLLNKQNCDINQLRSLLQDERKKNESLQDKLNLWKIKYHKLFD